MKARPILITAQLLAFACCCRASAAISVLPDAPDQAAAVATSQTAGRWMVFRAAPFGVVTDVRILTDSATGVSACVFQGPAGAYAVVLIPNDQASPIETAEVILDGVAPNPDPDPNPGPTPGPEPNPVPDGYLGLTKIAHDYAAQLKDVPLSQVARVRDNYATVAKDVAQYQDEQAMKRALVLLNRGAVPADQRAAWSDWDSAITTVLDAHDAELRADLKKIGAAYLAIADGLTRYLAGDDAK